VITAASKRLQLVEEYYFSRKLEEIRRLEMDGRRVINLGIGNPDLSPPRQALDEAARKIQEPTAHGYQPYRSTPELRAAIARSYASLYGVTLDPATQVLPLLGSKEGVFYLSGAFLDPGDEVLYPDPGYPAYAASARLLGATPVAYDLTEEGGWLPDLDALARRDLSRVKLMWVNYPHMPTGARAPRAFLDRLARFAREQRILVANDNPYSRILNPEPMSLLASPGALDACVELNSLSKSCSMAGWRVGYLLGAADVVQAVLQLKSTVDSGMFLPLQAGAAAALAAPASYHAELDAAYRERREAGRAVFQALGFRAAPEQSGLFLWARAPESVPDVEARLDELLRLARVFLVPGRVFGRNGERYARLSLCAPAERIREAAERVGA
jgi:LL-diaminopimelate aminotransferase